MAHNLNSNPRHTARRPVADPTDPKPVIIPNTVPCLFCGGTMEQRGPQYAGSGMNSLTYVCPRCNAVCSHFWNHDRKIQSINHIFHYADEEDKCNG